jgi:hypothetical protein
VTAIDAMAIAAGSVLLLATLYDIFQSVVLPRPAVGRIRISVSLIRLAWMGWRGVNTRWRKLQVREGALASFAPLAVIVLLLLWGFLLVLAYSLILYGLREQLHPEPEGFGTTLFFSAGRMLAFPVDGIEAGGGALRVLTSLEAATGFGLFALVISLLFSLFSAFQRREVLVVGLDALAGAPPSGVAILENCAKHDMPEELVATFERWRDWTVDVLESHLSYPLLIYFRSSHDNEAWPNSFGAVMDASSLVISTIEGGPTGQAYMIQKVGVHFVEDIGRFYRYRGEPNPGVERIEFEEAYGRLRAVGYRLHDVDTAWKHFVELRSVYAPWLNRASKALAVPPAPWIGDRSYLPHRPPGQRSRRRRPSR